MATDPNETKGPMVIAICIAFGSVTVVTMCLRLFARFVLTRSPGPDDYLMIVAAVFSWAFIVITAMAVHHGLGSHIEVVVQRGQENLVEYAQIVWFSSIFYNACLGFIKTSVLSLYARLGDPQLRKLALGMIVIVACQAVANVLTCIFQCSPIPAAWDLSITEKTCVDINAFYLANAALNIATDLLSYALPIRLVLKLQVPFKQKVILFVMFFLGLLYVSPFPSSAHPPTPTSHTNHPPPSSACISSIVRITFIPLLLSDPDATWAITAAMYWSVIETNIGILAASIPSFKAIAKRYFPRLVGEYSSRARASYYVPAHGRGSLAARGVGPFNKLECPDSFVMRGMGDVEREAGEEKEKEMGKGMGTRTRIGGGRGEETKRGSTERIVMPEGQIVTQTEITRHVEEQSDAGSY
ncbi:hypothetical protein MMC13_001740 [Lambiella insularis]|nr:hypothetical protein [Lambiella insularis]